MVGEIKEVKKHGIVTYDDKYVECDVIIFATGYE
jgi:thioredoxin reductase